ncbi:dioxygenase family protein [Egbenema bharatensis]|uniref:dioxygenase family protein n=1 Tax=Egbenema bharatensis TaxID=3463334 RepID=UPI003A84DAD1
MVRLSRITRSRRTFLKFGALLFSSWVGTACTRSSARSETSTSSPSSPSPNAAASPAPASQAQTLTPTPACGDDEDITPAQTAGPFYTPNAPERSSLLEPGIVGTPLILTGVVLSRNCEPIAGALVDFWQADDRGEYDNQGYRLRGHQFTDAEGRYFLETIVPGFYPGRTRHIHVKVQAANQPILTTQLYFPDVPQNQRDGLFQPELLIGMQESEQGRGTFDFVLNV